MQRKKIKIVIIDSTVKVLEKLASYFHKIEVDIHELVIAYSVFEPADLKKAVTVASQPPILAIVNCNLEGDKVLDLSDVFFRKLNLCRLKGFKTKLTGIFFLTLLLISIYFIGFKLTPRWGYVCWTNESICTKKAGGDGDGEGVGRKKITEKMSTGRLVIFLYHRRQ